LDLLAGVLHQPNVAERLDDLPSPARRLQVAAQPIDLGADPVREPVLRIGRPANQRIDERPGLGRAALAKERVGRVGGHDGSLVVGLQACLAGCLQRLHPCGGSILEPSDAQQSTAFEYGD
jgi:hypothetical protein